METTYNPVWNNVVDLDPVIVQIFGDQSETQNTEDPGVEDSADNDTTGNSDGNTNTNTGNSTTTETGNTNPDGSNNPDTGNTTTTGNNTTNTTTNSTASTNSSGTNTTGNDYYIEYKGQKFFNGGKIKIPYKRFMMETFEMKTLASDAKVDFTIHEPGKQDMWRGYTGYTAKTSIPIEDNSSNLVNLLKLDLQSKAINISGSPKVRVEVEKVVKPFTFTKLEAIDRSDNNNNQRIAQAGETLYYVDKSPLSHQFRKTEFKISYTPNLPLIDIPKEKIKWKFDNVETIDSNGINSLFVNIKDDKPNSKISGITGSPNFSTKNVNVKWVDVDRKKYQVVPPAIQSTAETVFNSLTNLNQILTTLGLNDVLEIKPKINMAGTQFNEIDKESRHYITVREGEINATVEAKASFNAPPPYSGKVKIPFTDIVVVDYGLYLAFKIGLGVQGKLRFEKRDDSNEFINTKNTICIKGSGGVEPGLKLNILPGQDNLISVVGKAYGKADITATGCYVLQTGKFEPKVFLDPLIIGFNVNVKTGNVVIFDNSIDLTLSGRIKIYGE